MPHQGAPFVFPLRSDGTCVEFGPTQLPVGLGLGLGLRLGLGLGLGLRLGLGLGLGLGLRLELGLGLGLGPNLIDRKFGGPEPDTSAEVTRALVSDSSPPNFRSIRLGPNPKLVLTNPTLTLN